MFMNGQKGPDKQASASNDNNEEEVGKKKSVCKKSTPSVEVSKMKGWPTGMKAPKFNGLGACVRCKHTALTTESITCELCDSTFHACCREKNGYSSSTAICTPAFHEKLMPVMTKYGSANANRWGNLFFICNSCSKSSNPTSHFSLIKPLLHLFPVKQLVSNSVLRSGLLLIHVTWQLIHVTWQLMSRVTLVLVFTLL